MSSSTDVGLLLAPDETWFRLLAPLLDDCDYYAVTPETLWMQSGDEIVSNGYHRAFLDLKERTGRPFVAHSVGWSPGGASADRRTLWAERMRADHAQFQFEWWTDHLGLAEVEGRVLSLPLPLPMTAEAASVVRTSCIQASKIVPVVGVENSAFYFALGNMLDEPAFLEDALGEDGVLLLDLHNLVCNAHNLGFDPRAWLERMDLGRVIEIHVSGGGLNEAPWSAGMHLDSHDTSVPEIVWDLLAEVVPECPALRGVTLERIEGSVGPTDVPVLRDELARVRAVVS